jgi:hypothetical protein
MGLQHVLQLFCRGRNAVLEPRAQWASRRRTVVMLKVAFRQTHLRKHTFESGVFISKLLVLVSDPARSSLHLRRRLHALGFVFPELGL